MKYYSELNSEYVFDLKFFKEMIKELELDELLLEEMKRDIGGPMWCSHYQEFTEECGKAWCKKYNACNGKNGRCRYLKNGFIGNGKIFKLTCDKFIEVKESKV